MKSKIREEMKARRKALTKTEVLEKSQSAQKIFLGSKIYRDAKVVMLYIPIGNEINTLKIIKSAFSDGKTVLVPVTDSKTFEITAHKITNNSEFEMGVFSLTEPKVKAPFDKSDIDVVLVPGVAFSKSGKRIGFGKGCYDKFLKDIKSTKVGFCYDFQLTDEIVADGFDIEMDCLVTENEFINCKNGA